MKRAPTKAGHGGPTGGDTGSHPSHPAAMCEGDEEVRSGRVEVVEVDAQLRLGVEADPTLGEIGRCRAWNGRGCSQDANDAVGQTSVRLVVGWGDRADGWPVRAQSPTSWETDGVSSKRS